VEDIVGSNKADASIDWTQEIEIEVQAVSSIFFSKGGNPLRFGAFMTNPGRDCTCNHAENPPV
jgi:hypothetical protein